MQYLKRKSLRQFDSGNKMAPKVLFLVFAIIGASLIWLIKDSGLPNFYVVGVPVTFIICYCIIAWSSRTFYIKEDQIGDNAYYMGFLFTLSSLAHALWVFQGPGGSDSSSIISSFGVALWSTIVGISLRVFFSQMRYDPDDIEKEAREKIAKAANILSDDLYQAATSFNGYVNALKQSIDEAHNTTQELTKNTLQEIEALNSRLKETESPNTLLNNKIDSIFSDLEGATKKLNELVANENKSAELLSDRAENISFSISKINENLSELSDKTNLVSRHADALKDSTEAIVNMKGGIDSLQESIKGVQIENSKVVNTLSEHASAMATQLEKSRKYTEQTHDSLSSMVDTLNKKLV